MQGVKEPQAMFRVLSELSFVHLCCVQINPFLSVLVAISHMRRVIVECYDVLYVYLMGDSRKNELYMANSIDYFGGQISQGVTHTWTKPGVLKLLCQFADVWST